ncbi:MAG: hypothetical protein JNK53_06310, partial [Phycisphaerae bacterium]|nr:hypothetical protein [Phycisphaerae bacterium]
MRTRPFTLAVVALLGALALYLCVAAWLWNRSPTIAFDPVAQLQRDTPHAPDAERAWPAYRNALAWLRQLRLESQDYGEFQAHLVATLDAVPGSPAWDRAAAMLSEHAHDIDALQQAAAMPVFGFAPSLQLTDADAAYFGADAQPPSAEFAAEFPSLAIALPYLQDMGGALSVLRLQALQQALRGDGAGAVRALESMLHIGAHVAQMPVLIGSLVQYSAQVKAAETAVEALALQANAFKPADLARLDALLAGVDANATRLNLAGERA